MSRAKRTRAEVWRPDVPSENTAPGAEPPTLNPTDWGVTAEEARDLLRRQFCPVCGEGPWKSPLNHAAKRHGILKRDLREAIGLTSVESVVDPELRDRFAERGRNSGQDMRKLARPGRARKPYNMTKAGRAAVAQNLIEWEQENPELAKEQKLAASARGHEPDVVSRRVESMKKYYDEHPEAKEAARKRLAEAISPEERSRLLREAWAKRGVQGCGTRAAYRRGCRCDDCRAAYLKYKRETR